MRIAVFGTGGAGGYFGAQLARAGEDVVFIARGKHLEAIRQHGLCLETTAGEVLIQPAQVTDDPHRAGPVDVVLLGVKTWQVTEAARAIKPMMGSDTFVVPLENGVEASSQLAEVLGPKRVVGGLCGTLSWIVGPGRIRSIGESHFIKFGELTGGPSGRTEKLRVAFQRAGVKVEVPSDIQVSLWEKFLVVVSFGGIGAVSRAPIGVIRTIPETRQLLTQALTEVILVAKARHVGLPDDSMEKAMAFLSSLAPSGTTSLQRDIAEGKPSELEAWNGAVVRLGRDAGQLTPLHQFIYHTLLPLELKARGVIEFPR
ncbi:MAG TPA: 2-dehydropantoate 2-reductase [Syntrophorhabdaceae bacterium]|nr:2-dehydropantoate 2-reductase [Syntrophorhabdaceae bacterium]